MIRLTDEAITDIIGWQEQRFPVARMVTKAQLREIHNWGEEQCQGHHTSGIWFKRRECTKCWQALLDELK